MTDKITIKPEQVVSRKGGRISYYDEGSTLRSVKANLVTVLGEGEEPPAAAPEKKEAEAPAEEATVATQTPAEPPAEATEGEQAEQPPPETPTKPSKRGNKTKEDPMATKAKSKSAPKKKAAKSKAPSDKPAGVRTIGGKPVNVANYVKAKAPGGGTSLNNGDAVAEKLQGKDLDEVYTIAAKALKCEVKELKAKYGKLNVGMQRMNLGNRLRKVLIPKSAKD